jgi:hypothetical protein
MQALKLDVLRRFPTLEVVEDLGELKVMEDDTKIYINAARESVNYSIKNRDREWVTEEYGYKEWNKWWN